MTRAKAIVITRHGRRSRLDKNPHHLRESSDPPLSAQALPEIAALAEALRSRYLEPSCAANGACLDTGSRGVRAESSGLARTLGTAEALLGRLFPNRSLPTPVYSRAEHDDTLLRAYNKCPAHAARLTEWYGSGEFLRQETVSLAVRGRVADALRALEVDPRAEAVPLHMFWNEFDALDVAIRASNASAVPSDVEGVLAEAGGLAAWVEARKFGASIEGGACGSALLREVAAAAVDVGGPDLHVFSAHYPTMLCALTAVGVSVSSGESADSWLGEALLPTGSALAFEVVPPEAAGAAAASTAVRLLYWDGSEWRLIPVPCSRSEARLASCPLDAFVRHVEVSLPDGAAWCRACDNDSLARCRLAAFEAMTTQECAADAAASAAVAVICLLSILLFGACLVIGWLIRSAKAPRQGRAVVSRMTFPGSGLQAA